MTISSNKHKRQTITNHKQHKSIVPHDSTTGSHPSDHPHPPIAHSTATQQQHRRTTQSAHSTQHSNTTTTQKNNTVRSSATVTSEKQQTHEAQQAASKTAIPTQPKSRHYTHIMTISSNEHKRQKATNYKQHKIIQYIVPHDSTTSSHPSTPTHSTQHSNTTTTKKNNTVRSSATVTSEKQQTHEAQQAASKTAIPTQPKSRHCTRIMTISSNKHK